jgi:hypothetical protein
MMLKTACGDLVYKQCSVRCVLNVTLLLFNQRVFEDRVVRRIFGPERHEVTREWRRLHKEELYALYSSSNIIRVAKSRRMRWTGHVARMAERRGAESVLVLKPDGINHLED